MRLRVLPMGESSLLVEVADLEQAMALHATLEREREAGRLAGVVDLVPAARTVLVRFRHHAEVARVRAVIEAMHVDEARAVDGDEVVVRVRYDGADLDEVATLLGMSRAALVERHAASTWRVAFMGFAPGFGYLSGSDPWLDVPRRSTPRTRIPAGAVAMAGALSGVYPRESPGGWQLLGTTDAVLWSLERRRPALLEPGMRVRFEPTTERITAASAPSPDPAGAIDGGLEVVRPGLQTTVQDLGRPGLSHLGVGASGTVDRAALVLANRIVGNRDAAAALECAGGGLVVRVHEPGVVALAGATCRATLETDTGERSVPWHEPLAIEPGDELHLEAPDAGMRTIVAVRGGIAVPPVLESRSTDTLAALGPRPLAEGDALPLGDDRRLGPVVLDAPPPASADGGEPVSVRIVRGPRDDRLTPKARRELCATVWTASASADRVGVRLDGPPLEIDDVTELASEGMVVGAIQVPRGGQPVVFLADHPLTGGYPVVAVVVDADLDLLGQLAPGTHVRLVDEASA